MKKTRGFLFTAGLVLATTTTFAQDDTAIETVMESPVAVEQPAEQPLDQDGATVEQPPQEMPAEQPLAQDSITVEQPPQEIPVPPPPPPPPQPKLEISAPLPQPKQDTVSSDKNAEKGFYLRLGGGYAFGTGKTSGAKGLSPELPTQSVVSSSRSEYQSRFGSVNTNENSNKTTKKNEPFSLGEGIQIGIGIGYMFNRNIGIELNGDYLSSSHTVENKSSTYSHSDVSVSTGNNQSRHTVTTSSSSTSETHNLNRTSLTLTPALRLVAPISDAFSLYSRIGVAVPISDNVVYEYEKSTSQSNSSSSTGTSNTRTSSNNHENKEQEFTSYFQLGYSAALGVNYALGKVVNVFAEVNSNTMSFEVKKGKITKWNSSSTNTSGNTTSSNLLANSNTYDKETDYEKEITEDNNNSSTPSKSSPKKEISFSLPASNVGVSVGLMFKF